MLTTDVPSTEVRDEGNARSYRSPPVSKDREKALKERAYTEKSFYTFESEVYFNP